MKTETNFMEELKEYFDKTPKEQIEKDWEATEVWDEVKEEEKTIVVNLIGSPGTGKSTIASELFAKMKWEGFDVELVSEYAKELVWEQRHETFKNELYLFAKQHHRLFRLKGKVKFIITDRPLILSLFYNGKYGDGSENFRNLVLEEVNKFDNINIFLHRTKPYIAKGRNQTEEESIEFAKEMLELVRNYGGEFIELDAEQDVTSSKIIEISRNYDRADT